MTDLHSDAPAGSRSAQLDRAIRDLLAQAPELEAAAVVSFDGLPMAAALPSSMDEDRVAAMSAALLSLGERAAQGLGRGELSQVYIEGDNGTVFLVSADDEAVLVAVASKGSKAGMMLYEVRRAAGVVAGVLRAEPTEEPTDEPAQPVLPVTAQIPAQGGGAPVEALPVPAQHAVPVPASVPATAWGHPAPGHEVPVSEAPHVEVLRYQATGHEVPGSEAPVHEATGYGVPAHAVDGHPAPATAPATYPAPTYAAPTYEAPLYELPVYLAQHQAPPAEPAAEPVWPSYAPTGSVMPGGGVPPSTWS